jgi:hypothetical protein
LRDIAGAEDAFIVELRRQYFTHFLVINVAHFNENAHTSNADYWNKY